MERSFSRAAGVAAIYSSLAIAYNQLKHGWLVSSLGFRWSDRSDPAKALAFIQEHPLFWRTGPLAYMVMDLAFLVVVSALYQAFRDRSPWAHVASLAGTASSTVFLFADGAYFHASLALAERYPADPSAAPAYLAAWVLRTMGDQVAVMLATVWITAFSLIGLTRGGLPKAWCILGLVYTFFGLSFFFGFMNVAILTDPVGIVLFIWLGVLLLQGRVQPAQQSASPAPSTPEQLSRSAVAGGQS